jgi:hypothetical protein
MICVLRLLLAVRERNNLLYIYGTITGACVDYPHPPMMKKVT